MPHGAAGVERQPEGVTRSTADTLAEAQGLLDAGMPFHAHEVFEDAWKTGPDSQRALWRGLAQLAVGVTHAARGNSTGAAALLTRGASGIESYRGAAPQGIDIAGLIRWARDLAEQLAERAEVPDAAAIAPQLHDAEPKA